MTNQAIYSIIYTQGKERKKRTMTITEIIKKLEKIVITAQLLKELHSECLDEDYEIHENVSFLEKHIWDIEGFNIERVNYENKKAKKHKRNRRPAIPIRRSTHNCQRNGRKN